MAGWILKRRAASAAVLVALRNHLSDLALLLRGRFRTAPADTPFPAGRIQTRLRSFPQHGSFEFSVLRRTAICGLCGVRDYAEPHR